MAAMLAAIAIGILGFVAVVGVGLLLLFVTAMVIVKLPRRMYWLRAPFVTLVLFLGGGWIFPVAASMIHPKGPIVAIAVFAIAMIGGDSWHAWRKKHAPPPTVEYESVQGWEQGE